MDIGLQKGARVEPLLAEGVNKCRKEGHAANRLPNLGVPRTVTQLSATPHPTRPHPPIHPPWAGAGADDVRR